MLDVSALNSWALQGAIAHSGLCGEAKIECGAGSCGDIAGAVAIVNSGDLKLFELIF